MESPSTYIEDPDQESEDQISIKENLDDFAQEVLERYWDDDEESFDLKEFAPEEQEALIKAAAKASRIYKSRCDFLRKILSS